MGIASGVIGGLVAAGLGALAMRSQRSAAVTADGWQRMRPGWYLHIALIGCLAFVAIIAWFFASGGSSRTDAGDQNLYALLLMLAFAAGAIWVSWVAYLRKFEWKGSEIRVTSALGVAAHYHFSDVVDLVEGFDGSEYKLHMASGKTLRVSSYMHGFNQFMEALHDHFETMPPPPPHC